MLKCVTWRGFDRFISSLMQVWSRDSLWTDDVIIKLTASCVGDVRNNAKSRNHNLCKWVKRISMFQNLVWSYFIYYAARILCSLLRILFHAYWSCWHLPSQHVVGPNCFLLHHPMEVIYSKDYVSSTFLHVRRACCCCCCFGGFFLLVFTSERNLN